MQYYETNAENYFHSTSAINLVREWNEFSNALYPNAKILDLGCGSGRDIRHFSRHGFQTIGIDLSMSLMKLAKHWSKQPVIIANMQNLPFAEHMFDGVWAMASLLHLSSAAILTALYEIQRVLKPNSFLFSSVKKGSGEIVGSDGRYYKFYELQEWEGIISGAGFHVLKIEENIEVRKLETGDTIEIVWLECLAKTTLTEA